MPNSEIPRIHTDHIPGEKLVGTELGRSVAKLDAIQGEDVGGPTHYQYVQQVISDARISGFNVLSES